MNNKKFIQLRGPFKANESIFSLENGVFIEKIGIQSKPTHLFTLQLNGDNEDRIFEIGKTFLLECSNIEVKSLKFNQDEDESTIVDILTTE